MVTTVLAEWGAAIESCFAVEDWPEAMELAGVVLRKIPRHLATYQRVLRAAWEMERWQEGEAWGRRLLRADPGNALAWRALAMAAEQRQERAQAHATWQRAFEAAPYDPQVRAGLNRTTLHPSDEPATPLGELPTLVLNLACLATLYRHGKRWERAVPTYRQLLQADPRRIDFQVGLMTALWQQRSKQAAYALAQQLSNSHPHLLIAWVALQMLGDADDKALARAPIAEMDPDGDFVRSWLRISYEAPSRSLDVSEAEYALLEAYR